MFYSVMRDFLRTSISSRAFPVPRATHFRGSSAIRVRMLVSYWMCWSRPFRRAPPPARVIPESIISEESSGGVFSSVVLMPSTIVLTVSFRASRISMLVKVKVLGRPETRSRPRTSMVFSSFMSKADPSWILTSSAVLSPISKR